MRHAYSPRPRDPMKPRLRDHPPPRRESPEQPRRVPVFFVDTAKVDVEALCSMGPEGHVPIAIL